MQSSAGYLRAVRLVRDSVRDFDVYPFSIPSIRSLEELEHYRITRDFLNAPERFFKTLFGRRFMRGWVA